MDQKDQPEEHVEQSEEQMDHSKEQMAQPEEQVVQNEEPRDKPEQGVPESSKSSTKTSSLNLSENIAGLLCYVATFISGIVFLILEKENRFVRFHAMQSIVLFGGLWILSLIVGLFPFFIGNLLNAVIAMLSIVLWIVLMVKTYQKETLKIPIAGELAEQLLQRISSQQKNE